MVLLHFELSSPGYGNLELLFCCSKGSSGVPPNWRPLRDEEKGDADPLVGSPYGSAELGSNQSAVPGDSTNQDMFLSQVHLAPITALFMSNLDKFFCCNFVVMPSLVKEPWFIN